MTTTAKTWLAMGVTLAVIAVVAGITAKRWTVSAQTGDSVNERLPVSDRERPRTRIRMDRVDFRISRKGEPEWEFAVDRVRLTTDGKRVLDGLRRGVYYRGGKPYLVARAGGGVYDEVTKSLHMEGGIEVNGPEGLRFGASTMVWDGRAEKLLCPGPVQFQTKDGWVSGDRLEGDLRRRTFQLHRVNGRFFRDSAGAIIRGER